MLLSLAQCRALLDDANDLTDEEVEQLIDQMRVLAEVVTDEFANDRERSAKVMQMVTSDIADEIHERAAIAEFDGNVNHDQAERVAVVSVVNRRVH